mmetsp:Transcript_2031/g.2749  ORF Transcript_2031/g.2749 Transcript_2031/m.2749 type:complete len:81 (-) Transcript_2031:6-248(-)
MRGMKQREGVRKRKRERRKEEAQGQGLRMAMLIEKNEKRNEMKCEKLREEREREKGIWSVFFLRKTWENDIYIINTDILN